MTCCVCLVHFCSACMLLSTKGIPIQKVLKRLPNHFALLTQILRTVHTVKSDQSWPDVALYHQCSQLVLIWLNKIEHRNLGGTSYLLTQTNLLLLALFCNLMASMSWLANILLPPVYDLDLHDWARYLQKQGIRIIFRWNSWIIVRKNCCFWHRTWRAQNKTAASIMT